MGFVEFLPWDFKHFLILWLSKTFIHWIPFPVPNRSLKYKSKSFRVVAESQNQTPVKWFIVAISIIIIIIIICIFCTTICIVIVIIIIIITENQLNDFASRFPRDFYFGFPRHEIWTIRLWRSVSRFRVFCDFVLRTTRYGWWVIFYSLSFVLKLSVLTIPNSHIRCMSVLEKRKRREEV